MFLSYLERPSDFYSFEPRHFSKAANVSARCCCVRSRSCLLPMVSPFSSFFHVLASTTSVLLATRCVPLALLLSCVCCYDLGFSGHPLCPLPFPCCYDLAARCVLLTFLLARLCCFDLCCSCYPLLFPCPPSVVSLLLLYGRATRCICRALLLPCPCCYV